MKDFYPCPKIESFSFSKITVKSAEQIVRDAERPATAASGKINENAPKTKVEAFSSLKILIMF